MRALELAPKFPDRTVTQALTGLLVDKGFAKRDALEKRAIAVALGRVAGDSALPILREVLVRHGTLFHRKIDDTNAAAAAGIAAVGTVAAVQALRDAAAADPELADVVERAIEEARLS